MEGKSSSASIIEAGKDSKNRKLIRIVISHLVLYLFVFIVINRGVRLICFGGRHYFSPTARKIIFLVMVIIVFPLVSVFYELERRKIKRKKKADIQNKKEI